VPDPMGTFVQKGSTMTSVTSSGVSSSTSQQASKLALLSKLFQTTGKSAESGKTRSKSEAAPPPPPPPPAQTNSAAGLASMFEALQNDDTSSVSDLLSRLLQAVDADGDGTISADELQAVTELATGQTGDDAGAHVASAAAPTSAYEALFQSLQLVFTEAAGQAPASSSQRYTDLLQSLAKAA
jgi:EF hand